VADMFTTSRSCRQEPGSSKHSSYCNTSGRCSFVTICVIHIK